MAASTAGCEKSSPVTVAPWRAQHRVSWPKWHCGWNRVLPGDVAELRQLEVAELLLAVEELPDPVEVGADVDRDTLVPERTVGVEPLRAVLGRLDARCAGHDAPLS